MKLALLGAALLGLGAPALSHQNATRVARHVIVWDIKYGFAKHGHVLGCQRQSPTRFRCTIRESGGLKGVFTKSGHGTVHIDGTTGTLGGLRLYRPLHIDYTIIVAMRHGRPTCEGVWCIPAGPPPF